MQLLRQELEFHRDQMEGTLAIRPETWAHRSRWTATTKIYFRAGAGFEPAYRTSWKLIDEFASDRVRERAFPGSANLSVLLAAG